MLDLSVIADELQMEKSRHMTDNELREAVWTSQKSIGGKIAPRVLERVKLRNEAAKQLGYENYWEMSMLLQEHDPALVTKTFEELDVATLASYQEAKAKGLRVACT